MVFREVKCSQCGHKCVVSDIQLIKIENNFYYECEECEHLCFIR